jgi:hypothetical protein
MVNVMGNVLGVMSALTLKADIAGALIRPSAEWEGWDRIAQASV